MSTIMLAALAVLGAPTVESSASESSAATSQARPYHTINSDIRTALRAEATAEEKQEREQAIRSLCDLHGELVAHPRFPQSETLQEYRDHVYRRLVRVKESLESEIDQASDTVDKSETIGSDPGGARGGGATREDHGQELVDLIQRTISPDFWDVVGGPGTIVYFRHRRVLVVRATGEVHGNVGRIVGDLRAAGQ